MIREKIKSPAVLARTLKSKFSRKKSVFTNGCFDLLHRGHVEYLEQAKKQGDLLIVALNTDASVKLLDKGPDRPINSLEDRASVMAALEAVDFVTWFEEETPLKIIQKLKPKVLVKGGDYKIDQIVGAKEVLASGGKVKVLKFVAGKSTTAIIEKMKL